LINILYFRVLLKNGFLLVPSENKKDQRSIEQTLADLREKKRLKLSNEESEAAQGNSSSVEASTTK
jgi:hypothetical protein